MSLLFQVPEMVVTCMQHVRRRQRMLRSLQGTIQGTVSEQVEVATSGGRIGFQVGAPVASSSASLERRQRPCTSWRYPGRRQGGGLGSQVDPR